MTTSQIVWTVVIVIAALVVIGLILGLMRKKSQDSKHARAEELRSEATTGAAVLPDARARAEQAEAQAEARRIEAERAEKDAAIARTELDQHQAVQEDRIRAADRLDPRVDHTAEDYSPEVATPAGPANVPADPSTTNTGSAGSAGAGGSSVTLEPTDTSPREDTTVSDQSSMRERLEGSTEDTDPDTTSGTHRA